MMRLIQIPFSHNCVKVRRALELKALAYEILDIAPTDRGPVERASGQRLVPVLDDGGLHVTDSTAILRHLEAKYPENSMLPDGDASRAECWLIEDWADAAFMEVTRRLAYWNTLATPGMLASLFFPEARGLRRALLVRVARRRVARRFHLTPARNARDETDAPRLAQLALDRLGGQPQLFRERLTVADVTLAAMAAPLQAAIPGVRDDPAVSALLDWATVILGPATMSLYGRPAS